ncbi:UNVERIFIED_CONTAM: hypothetical protein HDU68_004504, partial [Siphonaria sp. JEL0065]
MLSTNHSPTPKTHRQSLVQAALASENYSRALLEDAIGEVLEAEFVMRKHASLHFTDHPKPHKTALVLKLRSIREDVQKISKVLRPSTLKLVKPADYSHYSLE